MLRTEGLEVNRENLQNYRLKHGNCFLAEEIVRRVKNMKTDKIVLSTMRRSEDYEIPKKAFGEIKMILVEADERIRFERVHSRGRENDPKTIEDFRKQCDRDAQIFDFGRLFAHADFIIENNGTKEELHEKIDDIMKKLG